MSKKKLLEESTIRSFMKLANLQPLTDKFLKESEQLSEEEHEEEDEEEDEDKKKVDESAPPDTEETAHSRGRLEEETLEEDSLEEEMQEEGEVTEEGKESEGRPSSPRPKVKGVTKATKVKGAHADHKMKPAKMGGSHHTSDNDTISTKNHSAAPKKNNSQFEIVAESMDEEMDQPDMQADTPEGDTPSSSAGEGGDHQAKMKELINGMLDTLKNMASEYGVDMEISRGSEGAEEAPEQPETPEAQPPEQADQQKMDEMIERLTQRVAARLVKESKKRR